MSLTHLNISNNTAVCQAPPQHVSVSVLVCLVFFFSFLLNIFSLWVFCCRKPHWRSGTILQFNLAISDAIATPVTPMVALYFTMGNDWQFGRVLCQFNIALITTQFCGSIIFLTLISIHRYVTVTHFNKTCCMKRKEFVKTLCGGVWLLLVVQGVVYAIMLPSGKVGRNNQCLSIHQKNLQKMYFVINFILLFIGFILPFTVSAVCYGRLVRTLTARLNISTARGLRAKMKSQRMIGVCLMIFGICFLPLNIVRTIGVTLTVYFPQKCQILLQVERAYYVSWIIAGLNGCLDPVLYYFGSETFRVALPSFHRKQIANESETSDNLNL